MNWGNCLFVMPLEGNALECFPRGDTVLSENRGEGICAMEQIFPFGLQLQFFIAAAGECDFDSTVARQEVQPAPASAPPPHRPAR